MKSLRCAMDLDGVLAEFYNSYVKRFGEPKRNSDITKNVERILKKDKQFWVNLPVLNQMNFEPELYCTKRVNPKVWTKQWLKKNNFPNKPVYQMYYQKGNKADMIKGKVDVLIDDCLDNVLKAIESGLPALLFDQPYNRNKEFAFRIYTLDIAEIESVYNQEISVFGWN